ncbi:MAG: ABC transporter permease [Bryobacteraceae bacterium]|nr:ABC transporter permease [Bryobacteraceae bacterium]
MNLGPIVNIALRALTRNKGRSFLTALGIIIGIGSVIAMVSLGHGAQRQIQEQMDSMGTNMLIVQSGSQRVRGVQSGSGTGTGLTVEDVEAIARECPAVQAASPSVGASVSLVFGNQNWTTRAEGVAENYLLIRNRGVASGEFFTASDVRSAARVAVIGKTVADRLFPGLDPVGQTLRVRNLPFRVAGVLEAKGQTQWGQDQDDTLLVPYSTAMKKLLSVNYVSNAFVSAASPEMTFAAEDQIRQLLRQRHNLRPGADDDFTIRNLTDVADMAEETTRTMTLLLGGIAGVSLIVGGIGIMNIMLVSVTERTREIGIRMAVGARSRHVRLQFLIEAIVLGVAGGLIGIAAGIGLSFALSQVFQWPQAISSASILASVAFSIAVGVFFGYYPARKAASLDPIEALRYE